MWVFRSLLFWLGLFVLTFTGWSWWDSLRVETSGVWDGRELAQFRNADSQIEIYVAEGAGSGRSGFRIDLEALVRPRLPRASFQRAVIGDQATYHAVLPHWLAINVWLLIWGVALLVRRRFAEKRGVRV